LQSRNLEPERPVVRPALKQPLDPDRRLLEQVLPALSLLLEIFFLTS
jgi:hypothetical protein